VKIRAESQEEADEQGLELFGCDLWSEAGGELEWRLSGSDEEDRWAMTTAMIR
jgi:hypothetical protein